MLEARLQVAAVHAGYGHGHKSITNASSYEGDSTRNALPKIKGFLAVLGHGSLKSTGHIAGAQVIELF